MAPPPSGWISHTLRTVLALTLAAGDRVSAPGTAGTVRHVRVEITVDNLVIVQERVTLVDARSFTLEWRHDPCSAMDTPRLTVDGLALAVDTSSSGPWHRIHVKDTGSADSSLTLDLNYRVHPTGSTWSVPLVVPTLVVRARPGLERDAIVITVTAPGGRVVFPAFVAVGADRFEAHLSAMPSLVRLQPTAGSACARSPSSTGNGLTIRFTLLVLTMLLWIPLYFWWARRRERDA